MSLVLPCLVFLSLIGLRGLPPGLFGDLLVDSYLEFLVARVRPNSVLAAWYDLRCSSPWSVSRSSR